MKLTIALLFVFFLLVLGTDCILIINQANEYRIYTKPFLMPVLYIMLALETVDTTHKRSKVIVGLILLFSFFGDVLLLYDKDKLYFTSGLFCFLAAHILYTIFFFKIKRPSLKNAVVILIAAVFISVYLYLLLNAMWEKIVDENYNMSVIGYAISIGLMFTAAISTVTGKRARRTGWKNFVPGAFLFVISDSIFAITNFYPFTGGQVPSLMAGLNGIAMVVYGVAQLLLITGTIKFIKK